MIRYVFLIAFVCSSVHCRARSSEEKDESGNFNNLNNRYKQHYLEYASENNMGMSTKCSGGNVESDKVKFVLYVSPHAKAEWSLNEEIPGVFNPERETKVYIHGWLQEDIVKTNVSVPLVYRIRGNRVNLISVDWSQYSGCDYDTTEREVLPKVAEIISKMLRKMNEKGNEEKNMHLLGFGMGAHIAGLVGKKFSDNQIGRITGLSPMGMTFNSKSYQNRLTKDDAVFVDVIHTNMGTYGISKASGDIDFYPNGGRKQPNSYFKLGDINSHFLAFKYYVESIDRGYGFVAKKCTSWEEYKEKKCYYRESEVMGEYNSKELTGTFYLFVNSQPPYGQGIVSSYSAQE